ncbi:hypothetical protein SmJEL517_g02375 [Synchytrium microbalum]|uniref:PUM-HD domain-containing protein n=1 Tax=Synchytrium microbalum TaxID=1806994 RepID=A0A507C7E7_9FUNG|nr:uncharacterized protein SmJEL517_g02375 [Synchytrium microbalum]TPX35059.1 hypothetical protein SmJEL517_g02375 [Synchytrium microbalum]
MAKLDMRKPSKAGKSAKPLKRSLAHTTKKAARPPPPAKSTSKKQKTIFKDQEQDDHVEELAVLEQDDEMMDDTDDVGVVDASGELSEDEDADAMQQDDDDDEDVEPEEGDEAVDGAEADPENPAKKPRTAEEIAKSRKEQKRLLEERRGQKPHADMITSAKKLWEKLRHKETKSDGRAQVMKELMELVSGHIQELIFKHDASRIIQSMLKFGNSAQRDSIAAELKGSFVELSKKQYSRFLVSKVLNYCPKFRDAVMKEFHGKIRKLMRQKSASLVIEEAYTQYANAQQRAQLIEEFYGPQYALFKGTGGSSLAALLESSEAKKPYVLKHLREALDGIIDKGSADIGPHSIVHRVLLEYLTHAKTSDVVAMIEPLKDQIIRILHTREGARVSQILYSHAGAKDRKHIIKTMKSYVVKAAKEQYGFTVLITILESTDDTVLSGKAIIGELTADVNVLKTLLLDQYASRVVLHALCGRHKRYLSAAVVFDLASLDATRATTCRKDDAQKHTELLNVWSTPLKEVINRHFELLVKEKTSSHIVAEVMKQYASHDDAAELLDNFTNSLSAPIETLEEVADLPVLKQPKKPFHAIKALSAEAAKAASAANAIPVTVASTEHVLINRTSNTMIKELITSGRRPPTDLPPPGPDNKVAEVISDTIANAIQPAIASWLEYCAKDPRRTSGTAFVLVALVECGTEHARKVVLAGVKAYGEKKLEAAATAAAGSKSDGDAGKAEKNSKRKRDVPDVAVTAAPGGGSGLQVLLGRYQELKK